jgi:hypothetical protein
MFLHMIRRSFMGRRLLHTHIIPTPIQGTYQARLWRGAQGLHSVLRLGALGVATGATAIGTVATWKSTTITITIRTTISIVTLIARDKGIGSTIPNTGEMRRMVIEEPRTSSVAMRVSNRAAELAVVAEPVVRVGSVELEA